MRKTLQRFASAIIIFSLIVPLTFVLKTTSADPSTTFFRPNIPLSLANANPTTADPFIDGRATYFEEWKDANKIPDLMTDGVTPNAGYYYAEYKLNWLATSQKGNTATIPGETLFVAHDINGAPIGELRHFQIPEDTDWNLMTISTADYTLTCWVLAQNNTLDDSSWLNASGLANSCLIPEGSGNDLINDVGFIVRKNNDPSTDVHWFPGDPSPGDPDWDPNPLTNKYYGCFGNWNFSDSFYTTGLDASPYRNEEYEWSVTLPEEQPWCIWWWLETRGWIDDEKIYIWHEEGQFWLHPHPPGWPPYTPLPPYDWPHIIDYQITTLSNTVLTLPPELQGDVYVAMDLLDLAKTEILSMNLRFGAMDIIGTAVQHLIEASKVNMETADVIMSLVALEQDMADKKLYGVEWMEVMDPKWQPEFQGEIWRSYEDLRAAGLEILKIEEGQRNYTAYDVAISHFQMAWDHAQSAENIAKIALGGDFFSWAPSNPRADETVTFDSSPCQVPGAAVGDFDLSGSVDSTDLGTLGGTWGSFEGEANWDSRCDLYADGIIDSGDLGILGVHWGEFGNYISEYYWYIDNSPIGSPPTVNYAFASYSKTPHNVTLDVIYGDGNSTAYTQMLTIERDISIFSIWPSIEDYKGRVEFNIPVGKDVFVSVSTGNIGTITEYTDDAKGDFPNTTKLALYLVHSDGTEELLGQRRGPSLRRYWYSDNGTDFYRKCDWVPNLEVNNLFSWDTYGHAPEEGLKLKANFTALAGDTDLLNNELWFGPFNLTAGYDHDVRIDGIYTNDLGVTEGYCTPVAPYGTNFKYFNGGKFYPVGGPYDPLPPGTIRNITVALSNVGIHDETVKFHVYANGTEIYSATETLTAGTLWYEFTFAWDTIGWSEGTYTLGAYVEPVPGETELWATWDNNLPTQSIPFFSAYDDWGIYTAFP